MLKLKFWRHCSLPSWTLRMVSFIWNHVGPPMSPFDSITHHFSNSINSLESNWSLRCNRHSTIIFDSHVFDLGRPLAGDIPSIFLCIVDARPEGWSFRFVVGLSFWDSLHSCHLICLNLSEPIDPLRHWPYWFAHGLGLCSPNRLGGRAKRKQFMQLL